MLHDGTAFHFFFCFRCWFQSFIIIFSSISPRFVHVGGWGWHRARVYSYAEKKLSLAVFSSIMRMPFWWWHTGKFYTIFTTIGSEMSMCNVKQRVRQVFCNGWKANALYKWILKVKNKNKTISFFFFVFSLLLFFCWLERRGKRHR